MALKALLTRRLVGCGHILVTSRNRDLGRLGTLLEIPPMATEEGVRLLLRGYNDNDIQARHQSVASRIVQRLGRLALAIDQAAAYIKYKRIPLDLLEDFLKIYEAERQKILLHTPKSFWEYERINAFTTWELSFQQLGSGDDGWGKNAAQFLTLSAFFAPTAITESIFRCYHECPGGRFAWIQMFLENDGLQDDRDDGKNYNNPDDDNENDDDDADVEDHNGEENNENDRADSQSSVAGVHGVWDSDRFWDVVVKSDELSLLQNISPGNGQEGASFSLHPLIRDWLQLRLNATERTMYTIHATEALGCCAQLYGARSTTLEQNIALVKHMDVSLLNIELFLELQEKLGHRIESCNTAKWFAGFYLKRGRYHTSEDLFRRVLETERSVLGEKHPDTLNSMRNLADVLSTQGKYDEAEGRHRHTLTLSEMELGMKHPDTLTSMNNLASTLLKQGKYEEAEQRFRQTLTLSETELGMKHPRTLTSMNNLAETLRKQSKYDEADQLHRRTLTLMEREQGMNHPDTLTSMTNLALVLSDQCQYEEAERMLRETLSLTVSILGNEHPETLISMNSLAIVLANQSKYDEAERMLRETLKLRETVLGSEYPDTLKSMHNLGVTLNNQEKYEEAERMYRKTLMLRETALDREHPDTLSSMHELGVTLNNQKKYEEAERILQRTVMLREAVLGEEHPDTLHSREDLVDVLKSQGRYTDPEQICRETLTKKEKGKGQKNDGQDVGHGRGEMGEWSRGARISQWAKKTVHSMKSLQLTQTRFQDHSASSSMSAKSTKSTDAHR